MRDTSSLFFTANGDLSDGFLLNLTSEGLGILVSTVLITVAIRATQLTSRWLSVRGPRRTVLGDLRADADFALDGLDHVASSNDRAVVRAGLKRYSRAVLSMSKRLEVTRELFAPRDIPLIVGFITDVHTVNAIIEEDCDREDLVLPLTVKSKTFPGRKGRHIHVSAQHYYTQMFVALDRLFARYGMQQKGVQSGYDADFAEFILTN